MPPTTNDALPTVLQTMAPQDNRLAAETDILVARSLSKFYRDRPIVRDISLQLKAGEVLGLLGPNGAGKTTTVGMMYGGVAPSHGVVQVGDLSVQRDGRIARTQMGIVTQDNNLDHDFTVIENLINFAHHYRMVGKVARQRAEEVLDIVNLKSYAKARLFELSGGMQRKLVLARALLHRPQIIFLDEPTTGLDPEARQEFWKLVLYLKRQGCGIILTTHYMDEAERLCDRLLLMQQGSIIDEGTPQELIDRTVGYEVVEVEGIPDESMDRLVAHYRTWGRPFGEAYLIGLPSQNPEPVWHQLEALQPPSLKRRRANLEDVFLRLTGSVLR
jgi:lipooligosaccharide transport system ATP-binding protein